MKDQSPIILYEGKYSMKDVIELRKTHPIWKIIDIYQRQNIELFEINNPEMSPLHVEAYFSSHKEKRDLSTKGNWVYFPWSGQLIHMLSENEYTRLRTNRNRNLITPDEQRKLYRARIGIAGLSIGNSIALSLTYGAVGNHMKLAERDILETTNLNRIRAKIGDIGISKLTITTRQIFEINPYARLSTLEDGLTRETIDSFFNQGKKPQIIFDAIDDFEMKIRLRVHAKKCKIPVVMLTNLGDSALIDIERYDLKGDVPMFNGLSESIMHKILHGPITQKDKQALAVKIVGLDNVPARALASILEIKKTLVGRPQLGSTVFMAGGIASYLSRCIILNKPLKSGRYRVVLDDAVNLDEDQNDLRQKPVIRKRISEMVK